ncbi:MAG TPA: acyltransferase [Stenotrophomonas sp.]|nr:acyltransferase [Stenotrophomonas sp.]
MRLPGLDLLRAIAIVWVMLFHSFVVGGLGPDWSWLSRYGWMGVDLFFVLSGFLIGSQVLRPLAAGARLDYREFYLRRAFRILPAFLLVLLIYVIAPGIREVPGIAPAWMFLTFTLNLFIDYSHRAAFSHAWSLCVEEHFYLVFPWFAAAVAGRASWRWVAVLAAMVVLGGIALRGGIWLHNHALDPDMAARNWFVEDLYFPTWNRLDGLLAGVLLAAWRTWRPLAWERAQAYANTALLAGVAVMAWALWLFRDRVGLLGNTLGWAVLALGMGLLVFAGAAPGGRMKQWLAPLAGWLAAISYSLYLVHKAVYHVIQQQFGAWLEGRGVLAFLIYGAAAVATAAALHYTIERPGLKLRSRWLTARLATAAA